MKGKDIWKDKLNTGNTLYYHGNQCEEHREDDARFRACFIEADVTLTDDFLNALYDRLAQDADVYMVRRNRSFDFSKLSLHLVKCGFMHVVQTRQKVNSRPIVHCIKGYREKPLLSVIVPLYNEESTAKILLDKLFDYDWPMEREFVIVESNSDDRTRDIVKGYANRPDVTIVFEDKPSGKGNGVLAGIEAASGNFIAIQDGDLEYDVNDYDKLLPPLRDYETLFMLGSRYKKDDWRMRKFSGGHKLVADYLNLGQKFLTWVLNLACKSKLTDPFTMYKIFHKDCMYGIDFVGGNFGLDWEIVIRFLRKGYRPKEIPISYQARSYAEGKHICLFKTPIEGLKALWHCRFRSNVYDYGDDV